jgi:uncharacterized protein DUF5134
MSVPGWLLEVLAGVMLLVAAMSAGHLAVARAWIRHDAVGADVALFHLLLGIAIAGVLVAGLRTLPNAAWDVVFAATTAWFDWRLWRDSREYGAAAARGQFAPLLAYSAAMLYLFTALAPPSPGGSVMAGMPGMSAGPSSVMPTLRAPTLGLLFAVLLAAITVRDVDRPAGYLDVAGSDRTWRTAELLPLAPAVVKGRQVMLGVTIAFTLILLM